MELNQEQVNEKKYQNKKSNSTLFVLLAILILALIGAGYSFWSLPKPDTTLTPDSSFSSSSQSTPSVTPADSSTVDIESEIKAIENDLASTSSGDFDDSTLTDSEVGL